MLANEIYLALKDKRGTASGFTLLEMILAMIVGLIIVLMAYRTLRNVGSELTIISAIERQKVVSVLFRQALETDMNNADFIVAGEDLNTFNMVSGPDTVRYFFGETIVRHEGIVIDSFPLEMKKISVFPIPYLEKYGVIDKIVLDWLKPVPVKNVCFIKHYTAEQLMQLYQ